MRKDNDMETLVTKSPPENGRAGKAKGGASSATHKQLITRNLRLVYGEVAGEAVPDKIMDLLDQLSSAKDKSQ